MHFHTARAHEYKLLVAKSSRAWRSVVAKVFWLCTAIGCLSVLSSAQAIASCPKLESLVSIHNGLGTAQDCQHMSVSQQRAYMMGFVNGLLVAPLYGASQECVNELGDCLVGTNDEQLAAILSKYLGDHPEEWHYGCHIVAWKALLTICPKP